MAHDSDYLILDGAQGTELERHGADLTIGDLWSSRLVLDNPQLIRKVHEEYLEAGADVFTTLTYQATLEGFEKAGLPKDKAASGILDAVKIAADAREAYLQKHGGKADRQQVVHKMFSPFAVAFQDSTSAPQIPSRWPIIAFSSGSYGGVLADGSEFTGTYSETMTQEELSEFHKRRIDVVQDNPDIDILAFETVPCLKEAVAIAEMLKASDSKHLAWISFSCKDGQYTNHGEDFAEECVTALQPYKHVFAIGVNCTAPSHVTSLLSAAKKKITELSATSSSDVPPKLLLAYPNSGEQFSGEDRCWHHAPDDASEPEKFASVAKHWVRECGLSLVGGCCRTTPEHIQTLHKALQS